MAIHIADREVSDLMTKYSEATGMSKTEALRRLLRSAVEQIDGKERKQRLRQVANAIRVKNRKLGLSPITKQEADAIFE